MRISLAVIVTKIWTKTFEGKHLKGAIRKMGKVVWKRFESENSTTEKQIKSKKYLKDK